MTKKELIEKLNEIQSDLEDARQAQRTLKACLDDIESKLEDMPDDESEITDVESDTEVTDA